MLLVLPSRKSVLPSAIMRFVSLLSYQLPSPFSMPSSRHSSTTENAWRMPSEPAAVAFPSRKSLCHRLPSSVLRKSVSMMLHRYWKP